MAAAHAVTRAASDVHGFVWQGKQYEGLVCNALEFVWSHGGGLDEADVPAAARGLAFMRSLVTANVTPDYVTTLTEEPTRVAFGRGGALFLRNWPYAWRLFERADSPVRGRVGVSVLPHAPGAAPAATLGGWQLGVNAFSPRPEAAERLAAFLTAAPAQKALALAYGYSPPRRSLYEDAELAAAQPFLPRLRAVLEAARPRPVSPHYVALSQILQAEFSAVLVGERAPEARARRDRARSRRAGAAMKAARLESAPFLAPAAALLAVVTAVPMAYVVWLSLEVRTPFRAPAFIGLDNYLRLASDERFWNALWQHRLLYRGVGRARARCSVSPSRSPLRARGRRRARLRRDPRALGDADGRIGPDVGVDVQHGLRRPELPARRETSTGSAVPSGP